MCGRGGRKYRKKRKGKWIMALLAAMVIQPIDPMAAQAADQENILTNLVLLIGQENNSDTAESRSGVLLEAGDHSIVVTSGDVGWSQCHYSAANADGEIELELAASSDGIAIFETDRDYGGFTRNEILSSKELSIGDRIRSIAWNLGDKSIENKENRIESAVDNNGFIYVKVQQEFEETDFGGMILSETGQVAGVVVPSTLDDSHCLFMTMDFFIEELFEESASEAGGSTDGENEDSNPGRQEREEPAEDDSADGTTNLLKDSYFMPLILLLLAAMAGSLYSYMNRKAKSGGKTVYLEDQPSSSDSFVNSSAEIILLGTGGYFQGRGFDISKKAVVFGRNPAWCTAVYPKDAKGISSLHCRVEVMDGKIMLTDLGSSYGTFLENGTQLTVNTPCELQRGSRFYLADRTNMFQIQ